MSFDPFQQASAIAKSVRSGEIKAIEVIDAYLARIERLNPKLNAFTSILAERARSEAKGIDAARARGEKLGPLAGVPFAVKNLFDVKGLPTRAGSKINRERPPAGRDGLLVERLTAAGAILTGSLNMGEYAYDFTGENAHDGACRNPHDPSRMTGGSSSGSGSATAAGLSPISLGSDTNGSIRVPASLCGIMGLKPTYGRLPRTRSFPFCDSFDHLGPFARNVGDLALAYDALQGFDAEDHACAKRPNEPVGERYLSLPAGLKIAIAGGHFSTDGLPEAERAVKAAAKALNVAKTVDIEGAALGRAAAFLITNAESAAFHLPRLQARADDFDPDTRDRFLAGAMLPASWYVEAQRVRAWFERKIARLFEEVDVLIAPATPFSAPLIGQKTMQFRGEEVAVRPNLGIFTQPFSCVGLPVVAVPIPGGNMPIAVQVVAPPWREDLCLAVAHQLEKSGAAAVEAPAAFV